MTKTYTFLSEAITALEELGGEAHLDSIYEKILERGKLDLSKAKTPEATLRRTLQLNRADHLKSKSDTFYSVYGVGARKGYWGLVKNITEEQYLPEELPSNLLVSEGAKKAIIVNKYERDPKARSVCIENLGSVCMVCGFDFGEVYGEQFIGKIHVHHLTPMSAIGTGYQLDPEKELVPICPNCHYIAHLKGKNEAYSIAELKNMIRKAHIQK